MGVSCNSSCAWRAARGGTAAANAVRSGRLTTSLRYAGFGELDVSDVVALPTARPAAVPHGARRALSGTVADTSEEESRPALSAERAAHEAALREAQGKAHQVPPRVLPTIPATPAALG